MNYETEVIIEGLESSMDIWLTADRQDATETFGEDLVYAVVEALSDE